MPDTTAAPGSSGNYVCERCGSSVKFHVCYGSIRQQQQVMGCICPGDATPYCQNQFCPRKPVPNVSRG